MRAMSTVRARAAWVLAVLLAVGLCLPALARADGDPASDVLVATPPVFIPPASGISYAEEAAVAGQLRAAAAHGHPLRVAVIPDRIALGSLGALWRLPQTYAEFLDRELADDYRGELLVVMPNGFGVARGGGDPERTSLAHLAPRNGQLLLATEQAIARLTGAGAARVKLTAMAGPSRTAGIGWWVTTVLALAAVLAAWVVSLRVRPLRRRPAAS